MTKIKNMKGITLIALVITIIVLLILAGVSIAMLTGDNGILIKAQTSKTKSAQEEARERVSLMLTEWKMENAINNVSLNTFLMNDKYMDNRKAQGIDNIEPEESNYIATVTVGVTEYEVTINAEDEKNPYIEDVEQSGKRLSVVTQVGEYTFAETVEILIKATAPENDTIESIETTSENIILKEETQEGKTYTVSKNGTYNFTVTTENDVTKTVEVDVDRILSAPVLNEDALTATVSSILIDISKIVDKDGVNYPSQANVEYKYYYKVSGATEEYKKTTENTIQGLISGETYEIKVKAYIGEEDYSEESNAKTITIKTLKNRTLSGETVGYSYKNPIIPQGFYPRDEGEAIWEYNDVDKTEVKGWNKGLVITDAVNGVEGGNEFIWVPCTLQEYKTEETVVYAKNFNYPSTYGATSSNTTNDTNAYPVSDENEQIKLYEGFYVARYEAGYADATNSVNNNKSTIKPVSKKGTKVLNYIQYSNAIQSAQLMINDPIKYGNNKSGLITGTQWDTIMDWFNEEKIGVIGSNTTNTAGEEVLAQNWGTYADLIYEGTGSYFTYYSSESQWVDSGYFSHIETTISYYHASGLNVDGIKKNIADLGGNVWEWTAEKVDSSYCIGRGGNAIDSSTACPASYRSHDTMNHASCGIGFRVVLYIQ